MPVRLKHPLSFMSLVAMHVPTEMSKIEERDMFSAKLSSVLDQGHSLDQLIVLGDFIAISGIDRIEFFIIQKVENCVFLVLKVRVALQDME